MDRTNQKPARQIEDLPVEAEQADEVKGGIVPDGPERWTVPDGPERKAHGTHRIDPYKN